MEENESSLKEEANQEEKKSWKQWLSAIGLFALGVIICYILVIFVVSYLHDKGII